VRDHLFEQISNLLMSANIKYIKWDMNRPLTEVFSNQQHLGSEEKSTGIKINNFMCMLFLI